MKKLASLGLLLLAVSGSALADARADLQKKLATFERFSASFTQQVYDEQGQPMQSAAGTMQLSRPDRFRWQTQSPDESLIVSNGTDVWMYDPFVEQVTIVPLEEAVRNTPFLLIAGSDGRRWQQYDVSKQGDAYVVKSRNAAELIREFSLTFDRQNRIKRFVVVESGGQRSEFSLAEVNTAPAFQAGNFRFSPPDGVMIDDQR